MFPLHTHIHTHKHQSCHIQRASAVSCSQPISPDPPPTTTHSASETPTFPQTGINIRRVNCELEPRQRVSALQEGPKVKRGRRRRNWPGSPNGKARATQWLPRAQERLLDIKPETLTERPEGARSSPIETACFWAGD